MQKPEKPPLIIVGASARAAAECARRAGFAPWCVDLFGDKDLRAVAEVRVAAAADYPHGILKLIEGWAPAVAPAMYTGAMENHPDVIAALAKSRQLWAVPPEGLLWTSLPLSPATRPARAALFPGAEPVPADGSWLVKPIRSAGGRGIRRYRGEPLTQAERTGCVFQQHVDGESLSAVFIADSEQTALVGLSRQLVGESWLNAKPFSYCGSVGPLPPYGFIASGAGEAVAAYTDVRGFRGLFGADFVRDQEGVFWLIEINSRFTASVELYELACAEPLLRWHARCFTEEAPLREWRPLRPRRFLAKAIWFLPPTFPADRKFPALERCAKQLRSGDLWAVPDLADIPAAGAPLKPGQPLVTLFVEDSAADPDMLEAKLRAKADAFALEFRKALEIGHVRAAE